MVLVLSPHDLLVKDGLVGVAMPWVKLSRHLLEQLDELLLAELLFLHFHIVFIVGVILFHALSSYLLVKIDKLHDFVRILDKLLLNDESKVFDKHQVLGF